MAIPFWASSSSNDFIRSMSSLTCVVNELTGAYAPEHLILPSDNYEELAQMVVNAGSKNITNERTYTEIHPLDENGRVEALARLISGDHRDLHRRRHSFPTRRSSDLPFSPIQVCLTRTMPVSGELGKSRILFLTFGLLA